MRKPITRRDNAKETFEIGQQNCNCVNTDNLAVIENLQNENEQLLKMVDHYKDILKKVRIALIQERCANICNGVDAQKWFGNIIKMIGDKE